MKIGSMKHEARSMIIRLLAVFFLFLVSCFLLPASTMAQARELTGEIKGDVRLHGAKPKKHAPVIVEYHGPCGTKRDSSVVRLWKKRVMNVTLWLTSDNPPFRQTTGGQVKKGGEGGFSITSWKCQFRPMMTVAPRGSTVKIMNEDNVAQWVVITNGVEKKKQLMQESAGKPVELEVTNNHDIHIRSGFYPWMEAWIRPVDDVVAVAETGWDGIFQFKDIPPGEYMLHSWHPSLGDITMPVIVKSDKKTKLKVQYEMPLTPGLPVIESPMLKELFEKADSSEDPFKR